MTNNSQPQLVKELGIQEPIADQLTTATPDQINK